MKNFVLLSLVSISSLAQQNSPRRVEGQIQYCDKRSSLDAIAGPTQVRKGFCVDGVQFAVEGDDSFSKIAQQNEGADAVLVFQKTVREGGCHVFALLSYPTECLRDTAQNVLSITVGSQIVYPTASQGSALTAQIQATTEQTTR